MPLQELQQQKKYKEFLDHQTDKFATNKKLIINQLNIIE
jgi:hypothetical protein